jgi:hypothetical protein
VTARARADGPGWALEFWSPRDLHSLTAAPRSPSGHVTDAYAACQPRSPPKRTDPRSVIGKERFLSGRRTSLPDIDLDVESERRLEVYDAIIKREPGSGRGD